MNNPIELERFVEAQRGSYERAVSELRQGAKQSHWMWYIFPQLRALGSSAMAQRYGIAGADEARAYLAHPILGPRLAECTRLVLETDKTEPSAIFCSPDDLKFRSSMTLFAVVSPEPGLFKAALEKFYGGKPDSKTLCLLADGEGGDHADCPDASPLPSRLR